MAEPPFLGFPLEVNGRLWTADGRWGLEYEQGHDAWRLYNADGAASERVLPTAEARRLVAEVGPGDDLMRRWDDWHDFGATREG